MKKAIMLTVSILLIIFVSWRLSVSAGRSQEQAFGSYLRVYSPMRADSSSHIEKNKNALLHNMTNAPTPNEQYIAHAKSGKLYRQLYQLSDDSTNIVIGVPILEKAGRPRPDKHMIFTYYQIYILDSIKGNMRKGNKVLLNMPGGNLVTKDGESIGVKMPDDWKSPVVGQAYIFFLKKGLHSPYEIVGGPQGMFSVSPWSKNFSLAKLPDVSAGRVIIPQVIEAHKLMKDYKGMGVDTFIQQVRQTVKQQ